jgi:RNA polymerase sigma-70 factor, ECF subfamily
MPSPSQDAFLQALVRRDRAAWGAFYDAHLREIYSFVNHLMDGDRASCEDVNQDVWLQAISCIDKFDPRRGELRDWLFGIARLRVALHFRRLSNSSVVFVEDLTDSVPLTDSALLLPAEVMERVERRQLVRAALTAIPHSHRLVLQQKYIDGRSVQEIATAMRTTAKAVESLLSRGRERMRVLLGPYFGPVRQQGGARL